MTPVLAPSCSNDANKLQVKLDKDEVISNHSERIDIILTYEGTEVKAKKINSITTSDMSILAIELSEVSLDGQASFWVYGKKNDLSATVTLNITDINDNTTQVDFEIKVKEGTLIYMNIKSSNENAHWNKWYGVLFFDKINTAIDGVSVSFNGSTENTKFKIYDESGSEIPSNICSIADGGAITFSNQFLTDASTSRHLKIESDGVEPFLLAISYQYIGTARVSIPQVELPKEKPTHKIVVGAIIFSKYGNTIPQPNPFNIVEIDEVTGNTGLSKQTFQCSWNDDWWYYEVYTNGNDWDGWTANKTGQITVSFTTDDGTTLKVGALEFQTAQS